MIKIRIVLATLIITATGNYVSAQCPTSVGLIGTPMSNSQGCYMRVTDAIPNSVVSISNVQGVVAQGTANAAGTAIIPYPCTENIITSISSTYAGSTTQTCNDFTFAPMVSLPVKLSSFTASLNDRKQVVLKWETVFEIANERFEIQKSTDGSSYSTIASLNSSGDSYELKQYTYNEISFFAGDIAFYRLRQIDQNSHVTYSKTIYINDKASDAGGISLFPNPLNGSGSTIQLKGLRAGEISYDNLRICDLSGKNISYRITGPNSFEPLSALQNGIYIVKVKDKTLKLIKQL
ncbi:MAG: T9SS type A sorting domain-containing protein [Chitinophagaceae bacterium]|nr:T9SS type A sorting domain-containing protein [Chitinophagaceae bacterium]